MTTISNDNAVPPAAYMLADHLDAALAAGEDILAAGRKDWNTAFELAPGAALRSQVELVRALELALVTRVVRAREWSRNLDRADTRFRQITQLFLGGTNTLVDALAEFADTTEADFAAGDGIVAYFRSRGVIDEEAAALPVNTSGLIDETFRVTGRNELGELLNLIATYLDALEDHFVLFHAPAQQAVTPATTTVQLGG